jgi:hypothetical protein
MSCANCGSYATRVYQGVKREAKRTRRIIKIVNRITV